MFDSGEKQRSSPARQAASSARRPVWTALVGWTIWRLRRHQSAGTVARDNRQTTALNDFDQP
ncbi:hypothetical protein GU927_013925 [Rhodobacteraceae bacterium HSP-20]|uniref:Uncharacterized protein n=1 Tax=Paragemmobacter amnigenus TaxID=2852097 RepID=A0ABS6J5A4_9RHOB|nr:hypothetical protein [Rhodobacter amnigenus]MBU9698945.1 hypothetical protein [Rhodobacter amnigenus]MBV4390172.1 hypothetical protein [Rhodobacter amnigenus]